MKKRFNASCYPGRQSGVVLLVALIALVAITLAGLALRRSVDTGIVIAGNLAFKQVTTQAGDAGTEAAITWLQNNAGNLNADSPGNGYYATWMENCDLTGNMTVAVEDAVKWSAADPAGCGMTAVGVQANRLPAGYEARYVINRGCSAALPANDPTNSCSAFQSSSAGGGSTKGGPSYGQLGLGGSAQQYYRITTRVTGPRNTIAFVQATVVF